ncbi:MFS transporter [Cohnella thailandensis]|uniref:MFS transporter n=1 Tax=Cohnella thailandensis TaxID=557557 RepID=A0A841T5M1_9BACL|nr:MFS transporter [Cohnella thailandensis]MBB6637598.1 MFS transporter [Cohnella thailandensis]MBP1974226.1 putative MFS family arabinose efflux permease [Cohnella thailandensis]
MNKMGLVYLLAFGGFVMGTAEMVVMGILGMIRDDFNVSVGTAGQLVTLYAIVFAVGTPILVSLTGRMKRKRLLMLTFLLFIVGNMIAFFSPNFTVLMLSRVFLAASQGVFTVVALMVSSSLVAPEKQGNAIGIIYMGFSTALVAGTPIGTIIGEFWGWRPVFMLIAILSVLAVVGIAAWMPKVEEQKPIGIRDQLMALKDRRIVSGLAITFFWITGYQLMFTYIAPFLETAVGMSTTLISTALFVCGLFAVVGSRIGGYGADKWGMVRTLLVSLLLHAAALAVLPLAAATVASALIILAIWFGAAWMTTPAQQYYLISLNPEASGLALGLNSSVLQLGMAVGAGLGGWVVSQTSLTDLGWVAAISILLSLFAALYSFSLRSNTQSVRSL